MTKKYNKLVDDLRLLAAILVVAIHTGPFASMPMVNYFITNIIGRFAVPYFFALSGYYFYKKLERTDSSEHFNQLKKTLFNLLKLYALTLILYVPVWLYLNDFSISLFISDLLWNGIHYHLWYFPALLIGMVVVYVMYKKLTTKQIFIIVAILYLFGAMINVYGPLLGEETLSLILNTIGTPRNGIFFAPLFVFIGHVLARFPVKFKRWVGWLSLVLFIGEGILWFVLGTPDPLNAMFLTLPIATYFLMNEILERTTKTHGSSFYHQLSLYVYVIHPIVILGLRLIVSLLNMELNFTLLFVMASLLSLVCAYVYDQLKGYYEKNA